MGPFSVKLKAKWHLNCKGSDSSCLWRSAMMLWNVRGWVPWKYLTDVRKLLTFAAFFLVATYSQWVITTLGTFSVVVNPICAEQNIIVSTRTIVKHATDSMLGRKVCDGQYVGAQRGKKFSSFIPGRGTSHTTGRTAVIYGCLDKTYQKNKPK